MMGSDETMVTVTISARMLAVAREIAVMAGADDDELTDRQAVEEVINATAQGIFKGAASALMSGGKGGGVN